MPQFTVKNSDVPSGMYRCQFVEVEKTDHDEYGPGLKWIFEITEGPCEGKHVYRTTKLTPTPKNSLGKFLAMLAGVDPQDGLNVDTDKFRGKFYSLMVGKGPSGSARVESFTPEMDAKDCPF